MSEHLDPAPEQSINPFAASAIEATDREHADSAELLRRSHLKHEASIKSIGTLYFLAAGISILPVGLTVSELFGLGGSRALGFVPATQILVLLFLLGYAMLLIASGRSLRRFGSFGRYSATVISAIGLLGFPLGTVICGYFLYLLWSSKGTYVFSPEYQDVIEETPHIKYKTSVLVWISLGLLVAVLVLAIVGLLFLPASA